MGYKGNFVRGEVPESGAIFMSNSNTKEECLDRKLFGLPSGMSDFVLQVKKGMTLFLFEFERRLLYGVFRATSDGEINIEPKAFRSSGKHFPAQIRFTTIWDCSPLAEHEFRDVIRDNYHSKKKFHFGLNEKQVNKLMKLFRSNILSKNRPERSIRRYDDKPAAEGNARSSDLRKDIRHRIRFDSCDSRGDEVKEVDDNMYINKHIIESRQQKDKREEFLTYYPTESDEFGDYGRHDILGRHLDLREKHIEDDYIPVFSKSHGKHLDESSDFLMDGENKDIIDYNRLHDEYNVREGFQPSLNEYPLTNHVYSHFNQNAYSSCDPTRTDVPDIQFTPSCFDDESSFIPIVEHSPERIPMSKSLPYYSHNEGSIQYLDDPGSHSYMFPKFISRKLSSSDADLCVHEGDPTYDDKRFYETHENKHVFGTTNKRASVFSRLSSTVRHEEQPFETDEKHGLDSSVDKVMKMLEKVASSPVKRTRKSSSVFKQDGDDDSTDSKTVDHEFPDVNFEADDDMAYEEGEVESAFQETRLVDFKRRKKSNKRIVDTSKESSEGLVGSTSDVGPVDQSTDMPSKRRKLVRPAFVEKNFIPDGVSAHEKTLSENDSISRKVVETSEKVDTVIKSMENVLTVPTSYEISPDDGNLTKAGSESSMKVDVSIKPIDLNMLPTSDESSPSNEDNTKDLVESSEKVDVFIKAIDINILPTSDESLPSKDDNNSTKHLLESSHVSTSECQKSGNEGDGNAENRLVSDAFVEATPVASMKDDQKMCGWIEW
ncbi:hypothetical protein L1987_37256 [Smallanthus sonchifolius]|uniref:Uncharacterized protein n=1 Tax=Smallanthus sonchifolius TaxID=185202 RepID=A0ACB9HGQ2_9ASTR|nr:hypothetical protein L1987_37256 [Smallanthus sonchifolius]